MKVESTGKGLQFEGQSSTLLYVTLSPVTMETASVVCPQYYSSSVTTTLQQKIYVCVKQLTQFLHESVHLRTQKRV